MPRHTFSPGQRVRIRSWESLAAEYSVRGSGDIPCPGTFAREMRRYCGQLRTVRDASTHHVSFVEGNNGYFWSPEMLEPVGKRCPRDRAITLFYARMGRGQCIKRLVNKLARRYHVS